uniref:Transmembrane protein 182 n=1 Tax=Bos indicus x Bos taurus TaxID=30522 RepID=A0A4W2DF25_BOBOX
MRLNIAIFFGALFGALGVLLFLVAFGSDYWLLATEVAKCSGEQNIENVTFHHEGFFWRCWFNGIVEENDSNIWQFWYTNQPLWKNCTHAYLSPYPFLRGEHNSTSYDSAVIYRGFWAVLMLLGVVAVVTASFLIICAAPFTSHLLYKAGGGAYIAADGLERAEPHSDWPCWCVHAGGLWYQHAGRRWYQHAGRLGTSHARPWRADVTAVRVSRGGVRGLPRALSAAQAESEGPVSSLPALGQMPPPAGPCVPHGSSVPDQVRGDRQDVTAPESV